MKRVLEGSQGVSEMVTRCRPQVVSAYPITPQTHIVEFLSQKVANGELQAQFVNVESEFSAASVVLGASATGVRTYTATSSQGLLLMNEVVYNLAGLRLPVVMTVANRAISPPLSIWNDWQDSISVRDAGWLQLYAEDNQEAADMHLQAYRIGEDQRVALPVMVCMDGFILTHAFEPIDIPEQEQADAYLPPYDPLVKLDPAAPLTMGAFMEPDKYLEARYLFHQALAGAAPVVEEVARSFGDMFGRYSGGLLDLYRMDDAEVAMITMGTLSSTVKGVVDELRAQGQRAGAIRIRCYRPFPKSQLASALSRVAKVAVLEKALSVGVGSIVAGEVHSTLYGTPIQVNGYIVGLGGRDIPPATVRALYEHTAQGRPADGLFVDLKAEHIGDENYQAWRALW